MNTYDAAYEGDFRGINIGNYPALVLNADFSALQLLPLSTWHWQQSIHAVISDRVTVVSEYDKVVRSPSVEFKLPSVIALREYVHRRRNPTITRMNLITLRDKNACCYCGQKFPPHMLEFEHVIPKCQGGKSRWENLVAACRKCNAAKDGRTPEQARMPLKWRPWLPSQEELARSDYFYNRRKVHESWKPFLNYAA